MSWYAVRCNLRTPLANNMAPRRHWILSPRLTIAPIKWSELPVNGGPFPKHAGELVADPKAIRETLRRQREQRGVKVHQSKLP